MQMFVRFAKDVVTFLVSCLSAWQAYLTGGVVQAAVNLYERSQGRNIAWGSYRWGVAAFLVVAFFVIWRREHNAKETAELRLADTPDLQMVPSGFYADTRTFWTVVQSQFMGATAQKPIGASMLHLRIINQPASLPTQNAIARDVIARIHFIDSRANELFYIDGRWADTVQPGALPPDRPTIELLPVTIGIGQIRELDIACKIQDDHYAYGFNNDSYQGEMLKRTWRMAPGEYSARVHLMGPLVNRVWSLRFRVGGSGEGLAVIT
jgi:hypothetical protein